MFLLYFKDHSKTLQDCLVTVPKKTLSIYENVLEVLSQMNVPLFESFINFTKMKIKTNMLRFHNFFLNSKVLKESKQLLKK